VWCPVVSKVKCKQIGPSISYWLLVLLLQTEAMPRPNVWGQGRGQGQNFKVETEAEAKILSSRPLWPRGLNISVYCSMYCFWSPSLKNTVARVSLPPPMTPEGQNVPICMQNYKDFLGDPTFGRTQWHMLPRSLFSHATEVHHSPRKINLDSHLSNKFGLMPPDTSEHTPP